jgi:hypothetical protein
MNEGKQTVFTTCYKTHILAQLMHKSEYVLLCHHSYDFERPKLTQQLEVTTSVGPSPSSKKTLKQWLLEELESVFAVWFKLAHKSIVCIGGAIARHKILHITAHLKVDNFTGCKGWTG